MDNQNASVQEVFIMKCY